MPLRGSGAHPLLMARQAAANANMRPRRRRELGLAACEHLWRLYEPPPGSRLTLFRRAFAKVETSAKDVGVADDVFEAWADALRFQVDDRDDDEPW